MKMLRLMNSRDGVTAVSDELKRWVVLAVFAVSIVVTTWMLQMSQLHFGELKTAVRYGIPVLLALGMLGGVLRKRPVLSIGWFGVALLVVTSLLTLMPGEDYVLSKDDPGAVETGNLYWRILFVTALIAVQVACLRILSRPKATSAVA